MNLEKKALVGDVFETVASKYDIMNDVMSAGLHRYWKEFFVGRLNLKDSETLLDIAGGTGDIAAKALKLAPNANITVIDPGFDMMTQGVAKHKNANISWICAVGEALPVADKTADAVTISFGLRNCYDRKAALAEFYRGLKRGGRFLCLEFSHVRINPLQKAYKAYLNNIIPMMGEKITGSRASYQYLADSILAFPKPETLCAEMRSVGFANVRFTPLSGGIVAIHEGWKL